MREAARQSRVLVNRIREQGWLVRRASEAAGISDRRGRDWIGRAQGAMDVSPDRPRSRARAGRALHDEQWIGSRRLAPCHPPRHPQIRHQHRHPLPSPPLLGHAEDRGRVEGGDDRRRPSRPLNRFAAFLGHAKGAAEEGFGGGAAEADDDGGGDGGQFGFQPGGRRSRGT